MFAVVGQQEKEYWVFDTTDSSLELLSESCLRKLNFVAGVSDDTITVLSYRQVIDAQLAELTVATGYTIQLYNLCALKDWGVITQREYYMIVRWMQEAYHNTMDEFDMWIMVSPLSKDVPLKFFRSPAGLIAWVDMYIAGISKNVSPAVRNTLRSVHIANNTLFYANTSVFYGFYSLNTIHLPTYTFSLTELQSSVDNHSSNFSSLLCLPRGLFSNTALKEIELPEHYSAIDGNAFCDCKVLEKVVCKAPHVSVEGMAFKGCTSLKEIIFAGSADIMEDSIQYNEGMHVKYYDRYKADECCSLRASSFICHYSKYSKSPFYDLSAVLPENRIALRGSQLGKSEKEIGYYNAQTKCITLSYEFFNDLVQQDFAFGVYPIFSGAVKLSIVFTGLSVVSLVKYSELMLRSLATFDKLPNDLSTEFKFGLGAVKTIEIPEDFLSCTVYSPQRYKNFNVVYRQTMK